MASVQAHEPRLNGADRPGLGGKSEEERRERLFARVEELLDAVGEPRSLEEAGAERGDFEAALPELARAAFADPSIRTNPRMPLVSELAELLEAGYRGRGTPASGGRGKEGHRGFPAPGWVEGADAGPTPAA